LPKIVQEKALEDAILAQKRAKEYNSSLQLDLLKKVNLKTTRKSYVPKNIKRVVFLEKEGTSKIQGILCLRDRILQKVIHTAILPIAEYQSDSYSFGYRENRTAHQAISLVARAITIFSKVNQPLKRAKTVKISREAFKRETGRKFMIKGASVGGLRKSKKSFNKVYYKFTVMPRRKVATQINYIPYTKYMNVNILECFDNICHKFILEITPLAKKYTYLLKA
jgi:hypothetical protein